METCVEGELRYCSYMETCVEGELRYCSYMETCVQEELKLCTYVNLSAVFCKENMLCTCTQLQFLTKHKSTFE